jgi:hypothetical protein
LALIIETCLGPKMTISGASAILAQKSHNGYCPPQNHYVPRHKNNSVEEQIDETDMRKIPQIVWAESGSLIVLVPI